MEECKGCLALGYDNKCTNGLDKNMPKDYLCPCINCIVKIMCEEECEKFLTYARRYNPDLVFVKKG